jgi:hypothetical protein
MATFEHKFDTIMFALFASFASKNQTTRVVLTHIHHALSTIVVEGKNDQGTIKSF